MNRDLITPGRTFEKWTESLALWGGVGAILYPPVFYYISSQIIDGKEEYYTCTLTKTLEAEDKGETVTDNVRGAIGINCVLMVIYLGLHFLIFSRPKSTARYHRSGVAFGVVLILEIIVALV